jgi:hypothetical protein
MSEHHAATNTDTELWRGHDEGNGDAYADRVFVTAGGGIGFNCGGLVMVQTPKQWHAVVAENERLRDIIARRLACDGSNGVWDARLNYDLTEEMRAALASPNDEGKAE